MYLDILIPLGKALLSAARNHILFLSAVLLAIVALNRFLTRQKRLRKRLLKSGLVGTGTILGRAPTGWKSTTEVEYDLALLVIPEGREAYQTQLRTWIPRVYMSRCEIGVPMPVRIDPRKPERLVLTFPDLRTVRRPLDLRVIALGAFIFIGVFGPIIWSLKCECDREEREYRKSFRQNVGQRVTP